MTNLSGVHWADPQAVERAVRELADRLRRAHPAIREIRWFGSWVDGRATARAIEAGRIV